MPTLIYLFLTSVNSLLNGTTILSTCRSNEYCLISMESSVLNSMCEINKLERTCCTAYKKSKGSYRVKNKFHDTTGTGFIQPNVVTRQINMQFKFKLLDLSNLIYSILCKEHYLKGLDIRQCLCKSSPQYQGYKYKNILII